MIIYACAVYMFEWMQIRFGAALNSFNTFVRAGGDYWLSKRTLSTQFHHKMFCTFQFGWIQY